MKMKNIYIKNQNSMNSNYMKLGCTKNGKEDKFNLNYNLKNNKKQRDKLKFNKTCRT